MQVVFFFSLQFIVRFSPYAVVRTLVIHCIHQTTLLNVWVLRLNKSYTNKQGEYSMLLRCITSNINVI